MLDFVLNFLFPPVCGICGKLDRNWLCYKCKRRLAKYEKFELVKGRDEIKKLFNFHDTIYFEDFLYCFEYKNLVRNLLLKYKFSDCGYLSNLFANVILNNEKINEILKNYDIMIPVPMDKKKKASRGYNQTELITNIINRKLNFDKKIKCEKKNYHEDLKNEKQNFYDNINDKILIENCIIKLKNTKTQSTLSAEERTQNIKNAFKIKDKIELRNKKVVLFDDIATTGSTVNEISKMLKENGAEKILVLVIAKD